jgi:peptidyl-prolyl cis-trans isomerase-like 3
MPRGGMLPACLHAFYNDDADFPRRVRPPPGTGKGGESIWGGTFEDEFHPTNVHDKRGVLAMANKGPNTNRSQFFILYESQRHLNNVYTVFGRMLDGWDVLDSMERLPVLGGPKKSQAHRPIHPPVIEKITIHANPLADEGIVYDRANGPPEKRL